MIKISIDLIPFGIDSGTKKIGSMEIINNGTGNVDTGNYIARLYSIDEKLLWTGNIKGFMRRENTIFVLIHLVLEKYVSEVEGIKEK